MVREAGTDSVLADIPGLIEGAHDGAGLGTRFLGHVERCRVLLHPVDATSEDIAGAYRTVRAELKAYGEDLAKKKEIVALSKCDALDDDAIAAKLAELKARRARNRSCFRRLRQRRERGSHRRGAGDRQGQGRREQAAGDVEKRPWHREARRRRRTLGRIAEPAAPLLVHGSPPFCGAVPITLRHRVDPYSWVRGAALRWAATLSLLAAYLCFFLFEGAASAEKARPAMAAAANAAMTICMVQSPAGSIGEPRIGAHRRRRKSRPCVEQRERRPPVMSRAAQQAESCARYAAATSRT